MEHKTLAAWVGFKLKFVMFVFVTFDTPLRISEFDKKVDSSKTNSWKYYV